MAVFCGTAIRIIGAAVLPKKSSLHYTRHFSAIYKRGKGICLQIVYIWHDYEVKIQNLKYKTTCKKGSQQNKLL